MDCAAEAIATDEDVIENMKHGNCDHRSICQVNREIYQLVKNMPDVVKLLVENHRMAKRMSGKLQWHKKQ